MNSDNEINSALDVDEETTMFEARSDDKITSENPTRIIFNPG